MASWTVLKQCSCAGAPAAEGSGGPTVAAERLSGQEVVGGDLAAQDWVAGAWGLEGGWVPEAWGGWGSVDAAVDEARAAKVATGWGVAVAAVIGGLGVAAVAAKVDSAAGCKKNAKISE